MSALTWEDLGDWSPLAAIERAGQAQWLVDGVVPLGGITWMVAAPESFKTFIALDMAGCVAGGRAWRGHQTHQGVVLYLAAEGGNDVHIRRAAADMAAGTVGPLRIVQMRPRLDEPHGLASLLGLVYMTAGGHRLEGGKLPFPEVDGHCTEEHLLTYLTSDEQAEYERLDYPTGYAERLAMPRFNAWDKAMEDACNTASHAGSQLAQHLSSNVFLVVDTFSQTSADDTKATVSRYVKTLRDLQDKATVLGGTVTVLVIDHTTKSGDSYMGSLAKEGDSDAMLEVVRHGDSHGVTVKCAKMKVARPFEPVHLELAPFTLDGFTDAQGRPLTTLVVQDGEKAYRIRKAAGANADTAAAVLLSVLNDVGACTKDHLRQCFTSHQTNEGKNADAVRMAFNRAFTSLQEAGALELGEDGNVCTSLA